MSANPYRVKLSLADEVRLDKFTHESGGSNKAKLIARLVHEFFEAQGVKNPSPKSRG